MSLVKADPYLPCRAKVIYSHSVSTQSRKQCVSVLNDAIRSPVVDVSSVCSSLPSLLQAICVGPENLQVMYPAIFEQLLLFVEFSCKPPQYGRMETKHVANAKYNQVRGNRIGRLTAWLSFAIYVLFTVCFIKNVGWCTLLLVELLSPAILYKIIPLL